MAATVSLLILGLPGGLLPAISLAQTDSSQIEIQQQRERARREAEERQRQQNAPRARLPDASDEAKPDGTAEADGKPGQPGRTPEIAEDSVEKITEELPREEDCRHIERFVLDVPEHLSDIVRARGGSRLPQDPFRFALDEMERHAGACIGWQGLNVISKRVGRKILKAGYSTTRVAIPEQSLTDGTLTLKLIPGVLRDVRFVETQSGAPLDDIPARTWKSAFPLRTGDLMNLRALEQGLEQMRRLPSQQVDVHLAPGTSLGESDLVIAVSRSRPWRFGLNLDDSGARATGRLQAGLSFSIDNALGLNDRFSLGLGMDAEGRGDERGTRNNHASYEVPYGNWLFGLSGSSYDYRQRIAGINQSFDFSGASRYFEVRAVTMLQRDRYQKNNLQFRVARKASRSWIEGIEIQVQRRDTAFAEIAWQHRRDIGTARLDLGLAHRWGVPWFGAQQDDAGRPEEVPTLEYEMQILDATLAVPFEFLGLPAQYNGSLRVQYTDAPLFAAEWFSSRNRFSSPTSPIGSYSSKSIPSTKY